MELNCWFLVLQKLLLLSPNFQGGQMPVLPSLRTPMSMYFVANDYHSDSIWYTVLCSKEPHPFHACCKFCTVKHYSASFIFSFVLFFQAGWAKNLMRHKIGVREKRDSQMGLLPQSNHLHNCIQSLLVAVGSRAKITTRVIVLTPVIGNYIA